MVKDRSTEPRVVTAPLKIKLKINHEDDKADWTSIIGIDRDEKKKDLLECVDNLYSRVLKLILWSMKVLVSKMYFVKMHGQCSLA